MQNQITDHEREIQIRAKIVRDKYHELMAASYNLFRACREAHRESENKPVAYHMSLSLEDLVRSLDTPVQNMILKIKESENN